MFVCRSIVNKSTNSCSLFKFLILTYKMCLEMQDNRSIIKSNCLHNKYYLFNLISQWKTARSDYSKKYQQLSKLNDKLIIFPSKYEVSTSVVKRYWVPNLSFDPVEKTTSYLEMSEWELSMLPMFEIVYYFVLPPILHGYSPYEMNT